MDQEKIYAILQEKIKNFKDAEPHEERVRGKGEKYAIAMHEGIITFLKNNAFEYVCEEPQRFIVAKVPISDTALTVGIFTDDITVTTYFLCVFPFENVTKQTVLFDEMEYPYQERSDEEESDIGDDISADFIIDNTVVSFAENYFMGVFKYPENIGDDCRYMLSDFSRRFYYYKGRGCK